MPQREPTEHYGKTLSLTSFLKLHDVRSRFRDELEVPRIVDVNEILVPPLSNRYSLVGMAFDYLFRFHLQRRYRHAVCGPWVAETGLARLAKSGFGGVYDLDRSKWLPDSQPQFRKGNLLLSRARLAHERFVNSGRVTEDLLKACIFLAKLEVVYRAGYIDPRMGYAAKPDLRDLRQLIAIVPWEQFRPKRLCILNPRFGRASRLVGGADADLVLDDTLIEIKTPKNLVLRSEDLHQLVGYVILNRLGSIEGVKTRPRITRIAIYFARHADLRVFDLDSIIPPRRLARLSAWFRGRARLWLPI